MERGDVSTKGREVIASARRYASNLTASSPLDDMIRALLLISLFRNGLLTDPPCEIDFDCAECIPDDMPLVMSQRAANGSLSVSSGDEMTLSCGEGRLIAYPLLSALTVLCEAGRYRVRQDNSLRTLLELGCQASVFEDVLHAVEHCAAPLQGRAYQTVEPQGNARHVATVCFDEDRGSPIAAHMVSAPADRLRLPPHSDRRAPLTLLGNFNHMFDSNTRHQAEKLFSSDARLNRHLREIFKHERFTFADQTLTGAKLLDGRYFDDQDWRVAEFVSNRVLAWGSVAKGNLAHVQRDVAELVRRARPRGTLDVYAGTHGVMSLRAGGGRRDVRLKPQRFPVPQYVWTVVHERSERKALALIVLNDPFIAVSEIRERVFCESACGRVSWLHETRRYRNYEAPLYGLTFCCHVRNFTGRVHEMPEKIVRDVPEGDDGLLTFLI
ncbi:unnamed protein product [Leptosia nina]|uniref:DNA/RNA non-specific endonuclease domain-containing protein n=1 Tax=Leptosia nina TaxID=320188 RepID=A0AAV1JQG2_9NEOP